MAGHVCVVGSANLDLVAVTDRLPGSGETVSGTEFLELPGGKGLNQAIAAARAGARVTLVGAVGDDAAGALLRALAAAEGIDVSHLNTTPTAPTGRALIAVDSTGQNQIVVVPGANHSVHSLAVMEAAEVIASADVVLTQQEIPDDGIYTALRLARQAGVRTVLNPAPAKPAAPLLLEFVDLLVPNEHEIAFVGDVSGVPVLIVTEGERGSTVRADGAQWRVEPYVVNPVDTVAAGDAFCGYLAASLAGGLSLEVSLERATAAGALATQVRGAVPSLPTAADVDALIARGRALPNRPPAPPR